MGQGHIWEWVQGVKKGRAYREEVGQHHHNPHMCAVCMRWMHIACTHTSNAAVIELQLSNKLQPPLTPAPLLFSPALYALSFGVCCVATSWHVIPHTHSPAGPNRSPVSGTVHSCITPAPEAISSRHTSRWPFWAACSVGWVCRDASAQGGIHRMYATKSRVIIWCHYRATLQLPVGLHPWVLYAK